MWRKERRTSSLLDVTVPSYLRCSISLELMRDLVTLCTGITYDRESIETWLDAGNNVCPITNQALDSQEMIPNHTVRRVIQDWCVDNSASGIERIPTPSKQYCPWILDNTATFTHILLLQASESSSRSAQQWTLPTSLLDSAQLTALLDLSGLLTPLPLTTTMRLWYQIRNYERITLNTNNCTFIKEEHYNL